MRRTRHAMFGDDASMWANPYYPTTASPPLVQVQQGDTVGGVGSAVGSIARGFVNLFQPQQPQMVMQQPVTPLWVYAVIGVGGVVALGFIARSLRGKKRMGGYRRHRRSRK